MRTNRKDDFEPYWQHETDWLCTVEVLPTDNPEARLFAADIIGYLVGYANLTNTRSLALLGDPDARAYELLFSFSSPEEKTESLNLVRSNEDMRNECIRTAKHTVDGGREASLEIVRPVSASGSKLWV